MINHPIKADLLRGAAELEDTGRGLLPHRLPKAAREQTDDAQLHTAESQPSGVRFVFRSSATVVELDVLRSRVVIAGIPDRPDGAVDLRVDGRLVETALTSGGEVTRLDPATGAVDREPGPTATLRFDGLPAGTKDIEIWLPHRERVELVALRSDAPITAAPSNRRVWVHHGSSISQGSNADTPSTTWPALAAAQAGLELVNLGLSGSAMLDPFTARAIAAQPADLISVKIGINLVNADLMRQRAFRPAVHGFLDLIRDQHPTVPLIVIGPLYCPIHETTPGPGAFDTTALTRGEVRFQATGAPDTPETPAALRRLTLTTIRAELAAVLAHRRDADPQLHYVDGLDLYGPQDEAAHPLPDGLHPDGDTHRLIADRFVAATSGPWGPWV